MTVKHLLQLQQKITRMALDHVCHMITLVLWCVCPCSAANFRGPSSLPFGDSFLMLDYLCPGKFVARNHARDSAFFEKVSEKKHRTTTKTKSFEQTKRKPVYRDITAHYSWLKYVI